VNRVLIGSNILVEMEQEMHVIKKNLKVAQDMEKVMQISIEVENL